GQLGADHDRKGEDGRQSEFKSSAGNKSDEDQQRQRRHGHPATPAAGSIDAVKATDNAKHERRSPPVGAFALGAGPEEAGNTEHPVNEGEIAEMDDVQIAFDAVSAFHNLLPERNTD